MHTVKTLQAHIVLIQESGLKGATSFELSGYSTISQMNDDKSGRGTVILAADNTHAKATFTCLPVSLPECYRVTHTDISWGSTLLRIINAYLPTYSTASNSDEQYAMALDTVSSLAKAGPPNIIIAGDLNTWLLHPEDTQQNARNITPMMERRIASLMALINEHNLTIANTLHTVATRVGRAKHPRLAPDGHLILVQEQDTILDYFLVHIDNVHKHQIHYTLEVDSDVYTGSDHKPVVFAMHRTPGLPANNSTCTDQHNPASITVTSTRRALCIKQVDWDILSRMYTNHDATAGQWGLSLPHTLIQCGARLATIDSRTSTAQSSDRARLRLTQLHGSRCNIGLLAHAHNSTLVWNIVRDITQSRPNIETHLALHNGSSVVSGRPAVQLFADHLSNIYRPRRDANNGLIIQIPWQDSVASVASLEEFSAYIEVLHMTQYSNNMIICSEMGHKIFNSPFTNTELTEGLANMRSTASSGGSLLTTKILKALMEVDIVALDFLRYMNNLRTGVLQNRSTAIIVPIWKRKGSKTNVQFYRGITIMDPVQKLVDSLFTSRLQKYDAMIKFRSHNCLGFRKSVGTTDANVIIRLLGDLAKVLKIPIVTATYDLRKAFDKLPHVRTMMLLQQLGVSDSWVSWLKFKLQLAVLYASEHSYDETKCVIHQEGFGFPQGSPLPPILCTFAVETLGYALRRQGLGVTMGSMYLGYLAYADNVMLLAGSPEELQRMETVLIHDSRMWGMEWERESYLVDISKSTATPVQFLGMRFAKSRSSWSWRHHLSLRLLRGQKSYSMLLPLTTMFTGPWRYLKLVLNCTMDRSLLYGSTIAGFWNYRGITALKLERLRTYFACRTFHLPHRTPVVPLHWLLGMSSLKYHSQREQYSLFVKLFCCPGLSGQLLRFTITTLENAQLTQLNSTAAISYRASCSYKWDVWAAVMHKEVISIHEYLIHSCPDLVTRIRSHNESLQLHPDTNLLLDAWPQLIIRYTANCEQQLMQSYLKTHPAHRICELITSRSDTNGLHWLTHNHSTIRFLVQVLLGVSGLREDSFRRGLTENDLCRACGMSIETWSHFLSCMHAPYYEYRDMLRDKLINRALKKPSIIPSCMKVSNELYSNNIEALNDRLFSAEPVIQLDHVVTLWWRRKLQNYVYKLWQFFSQLHRQG